jgi:hypothetical protein
MSRAMLNTTNIGSNATDHSAAQLIVNQYMGLQLSTA